MKKTLSRSLSTFLAAVLFLASAVSSAQTDNKWMTVNNYSNRPIFFLYATNTGDTGWGNDRLGTGKTLPNGYKQNFNFYDGSNACLFDVKIEFEGGSFFRLDRVNACTGSTINVYSSYAEWR